MNCNRCDTSLVFVGESKFHEGTSWGAIDNLGELAVNKEPFLLYLCRSCGEVSFFSPKFEKKVSQDELKKRIGVVTEHSRFEEFMSAEYSRKYLSKSDLESAFLSWIEPKLDD